MLASILQAARIGDFYKTGIAGLVQTGPEVCRVDYISTGDGELHRLSSPCPTPVVDPANEWMLD